LKIKKISAGVDIKENPALSLHEQLIHFYDATSLSRFNSRMKSLEMAGGEHLFCSPQLLRKIERGHNRRN